MTWLDTELEPDVSSQLTTLDSATASLDGRISTPLSTYTSLTSSVVGVYNGLPTPKSRVSMLGHAGYALASVSVCVSAFFLVLWLLCFDHACSGDWTAMPQQDDWAESFFDAGPG